MSSKSLLPLSTLLPITMFRHLYYFRYMQLSHAFRAQFSGESSQLVQPDLERVLRSDCLERAVSVLHAHLLRVSSQELSGLHARWAQDVLDFDSEDWLHV